MEIMILFPCFCLQNEYCRFSFYVGEGEPAVLYINNGTLCTYDLFTLFLKNLPLLRRYPFLLFWLF